MNSSEGRILIALVITGILTMFCIAITTFLSAFAEMRSAKAEVCSSLPRSEKVFDTSCRVAGL